MIRPAYNLWWCSALLVISHIIGNIHSAHFDYLPRPRYYIGRIVGGELVSIKHFPHQVSLQYNGHHMCGGSIISEKYILTAAHCTYRIDAVDMSVRVGSVEHSSGGKLVNVRSAINHPNFDYSTIDYDYALLELEEELVFGENVKPIKLHDSNMPLKDGKMCTVSGWGATMSFVESSSKLRATNVPKVNQQICSKAYEMYGGITENMMCVGYHSGGYDSCQGDSGGPLISEGVLVGIVSWGKGCAEAGFPGVYANIATATARNWIAEESGV